MSGRLTREAYLKRQEVIKNLETMTKEQVIVHYLNMRSDLEATASALKRSQDDVAEKIQTITKMSDIINNHSLPEQITAIHISNPQDKDNVATFSFILDEHTIFFMPMDYCGTDGLNGEVDIYQVEDTMDDISPDDPDIAVLTPDQLNSRVHLNEDDMPMIINIRLATL